MTITHPIDDLLLELFPKHKTSGNDLAVFKREITEHYSFKVDLVNRIFRIGELNAGIGRFRFFGTYGLVWHLI